MCLICCGLPPICVDILANRSSETPAHSHKDWTVVSSNISAAVGSMAKIRKAAGEI
jgi:hypothetical protein